MGGTRGIVVAAVAVAAAAVPGSAGADPVLERPSVFDNPVFLGAPTAPRPISLAEAPRPPRHPFMAANDRSNIHDDAYQTDTADWPGPLGRDTESLSSGKGPAECASITFDSRGRIVTICVGVSTTTLKLLDPRTLEDVASFDLPPRRSGATGTFTDFSGGGYFYLDQRDRAVVPTSDRHLLVVRVDGRDRFVVDRDYDLTAAVPEDDKVIAVMPDWSGRIWAVSRQGVVATVDPASGTVRSRDLGEPVGNSFAVDETGGVFVVTDAAMYRFDAARDGSPAVTWREGYPNAGVQKPGQTQPGSGTTPTLMGHDLVAITDNADPMNVVVYRRGRRVRGSRRVCSQPVFPRGASATDNSLIGTARSLVVENNFGYSGPAATVGGSTTAGLARVDVDRARNRCHVAWESDERAPSVVPKLSLANGLVYTYTKEPDVRMPADDPWYLTAVDFRTGQTRFKRLNGLGLGFNNNYAPITLGPDGTSYLGVLGGITAIRDRAAPAPVRRPAGPRARVRLALRGVRAGRGRRCVVRALRARVTGPDAGLVTRVRFSSRRLRRGRGRLDRRPPFAVRLGARGTRRGRPVRLRATVRLYDSRVRRLAVAPRRCR